MGGRVRPALRWGLVVLIVGGVLAASLSGAFREEITLSRDGFSMNTLIRISVMGKDEQRMAGALAGAFALLEGLDSELSLYREGSALSKINAQAGQENPVPVPPDVRAVIEDARRISRLTGGVFNPLIGPITKLWKINQDPRDSASFTLPAQASLDAALALTAPGVLEVGEAGVRLARRGAALDLGGIAKGYASSKIAELLRGRGIDSALIDLGGNIQVVGTRGGAPWNIGVRDPLHPRQAPIAVLQASDTAIITSGGYERYKIIDGVRYSHFFDPRTGMPVQGDLLSATLVTPDGSAADALATAFMIMGSKGAMDFLREKPELGAILIRQGTGDSAELLVTRNLKDKIRSSAVSVTFF